MRFSPFLTTTILATLTVAKALPEPQSPAQTTAAVEALSSYIAGLQTDPALYSLATAAAASPSVLSQLAAVQASLESDLLNTITPASDFLTAVPTQFQSFVSSIYVAELSILSENGFTSSIELRPAGGSSTGSASVTTSTGEGGRTTSTGTNTDSATGTLAPVTSTNAAAMATKGLVGAAGVAAGLVGVVMAL